MERRSTAGVRRIASGNFECAMCGGVINRGEEYITLIPDTRSYLDICDACSKDILVLVKD